jgi:hypothetical protein
MQHKRVFDEEPKSPRNLTYVISTRVDLEPVGQCFRGTCPFHKDFHRSLYVYPGNKEWRCFGFGCERRGGAAEFESLMAAGGISRDQAITLALKYDLTSEKAQDLAKSNDGQVCDSGQTSLSAPGGADWNRRMERLKRVVDLDLVDPVDELLGGLAGNDQDLYRYWMPLFRRQVLSRFGRDGSLPVVDNLAYPKRFGLLGNGGEGPILQPGIVIASFPNLQPHLEIEHGDGSTVVVDSDAYLDGGNIIWTDQGTGILKALDTGEHSQEVEIRGISTKGFCLTRPPGYQTYTWFAPRSPEGLAGRNRPTYISQGNSVRRWALESFNVDPSVLTEYQDISGLVVKLQIPERSRRRHKDALGAGH